MMLITNSMMEALRKRRRLNEKDTSEDNDIKKMPPTEIVRELTAYELGNGDWADRIALWMQLTGAEPDDF